MNHLERAINEFGAEKIALVCGVTYQAVQGWHRRGQLPRTEWCDETDYAVKIEKLSKKKYLRSDLMKRKH